MSTAMTTVLDEEYAKTLKAVSEAKTGSEEAKWQLQKLGELHKQRMNEQKASDEAYHQMEERNLKEAELQMKKQQMEDGKKDRIIKIVLDGAAILIPVAASSYWMAKGLTFEQKGTYTSRTLQWVQNHLRLSKK